MERHSLFPSIQECKTGLIFGLYSVNVLVLLAAPLQVIKHQCIISNVLCSLARIPPLSKYLWAHHCEEYTVFPPQVHQHIWKLIQRPVWRPAEGRRASEQPSNISPWAGLAQGLGLTFSLTAQQMMNWCGSTALLRSIRKRWSHTGNFASVHRLRSWEADSWPCAHEACIEFLSEPRGIPWKTCVKWSLWFNLSVNADMISRYWIIYTRCHYHHHQIWPWGGNGPDSR